jgi:NADH-quinone oxidoreductase subunit J
MEPAAVIAALLALGGAVAAVSLRNLIHCALCLVLTFFSVAGLFLGLGAEFVSFAQVMVYVGAIAILIVFASLMTRDPGADPARAHEPRAIQPWPLGLAIAGAVTGVLLASVGTSQWLPAVAAPAAPPSVRELGQELMTTYVVALEIVGLLLTAAMIGAVVLAVREPRSPPDGEARS